MRFASSIGLACIVAHVGMLMSCAPPVECQVNSPSYHKCVYPMLIASCSGGGCHGVEHAGAGLQMHQDLTPKQLYRNIVNKKSAYTAFKLIEPGSPGKSYLYLKTLQEKPAVGVRMPVFPRASIGSALLDMLQKWIQQGAKDDSPAEPNGNQPKKPTIPSDVKNISFQKEIIPILNQNCLGGGCHSGESAASQLNLEEKPHDRIVGKLGIDGQAALVLVNKPMESLLLLKLLENGPGSRMPLGTDPLSEREIAKMYVWIEEGAQNN